MNWFKEKRAYLDWAAAAPVSARAGRAYVRASEAFGNPSSPHAEGRAAKSELDAAREKIARLISAKPDDVVFTSGATEANNIAIQGTGTSARMRGIKTPHLLYLPSAHASVAETMKAMERFGFLVEALPVKDGAVDMGALKAKVRPETALISMDMVCGETGTVWNTREVRRFLDTLGNERPLLHVDAAQAPLEELCERTRVGADILVLDAQKVGGMRGAGALVASRTLPLLPIFHGGGQERGLRSGTPSPALAAAFAEALAECEEGREAFTALARSARERLIERVMRDLPDALVNQGREGVAHILNLSLPGRDTDYLVALLDEAGFAVSTKSACESDSATGSRAVMLLSGDERRAASTLRVSWGPSTSDAELDRFANALIRSVAFLDANPV
jgi:cysteine desulfurase